MFVRVFKLAYYITTVANPDLEFQFMNEKPMGIIDTAY